MRAIDGSECECAACFIRRQREERDHVVASEFADQVVARLKAERKVALESLNVEWARTWMPYATSDAARLVAMHKARYEITDIDPAHRQASRIYLEANGFSRKDGLPWPPEWQLPE